MIRLLMLPLCAIALLPGNLWAEGGQREREFIRALETFDRAKTPDEFRQAAAQFETLTAGGYQNGALWYNAGNAYFRAGDIGRAIASYRKAKPFRPNDPYLDANLRQALSLAPGRLAEPPTPLWKKICFWNSWLAYDDKFKFALGAWLVAFVAGCALLYRPHVAFKGLAAAAIIAALALSIDAAFSYTEVNSTVRGVVLAEVIARKGNSETYEPAFNQPLKEGAEFTLIERRGDWVFAHFEGVGDGWLPKSKIVE